MTTDNRSDWLSNLWSYIKSIEERVSHLDHKVRKIENSLQTPTPLGLKDPVQECLDEDD